MAHDTQRPYPVHPSHLLHSKWSTAPEHDAHEYCHWEVVVHHKKRGEVTLRATLDQNVTLTLPWRALRNRAKWVPGWR